MFLGAESKSFHILQDTPETGDCSATNDSAEKNAEAWGCLAHLNEEGHLLANINIKVPISPSADW